MPGPVRSDGFGRRLRRRSIPVLVRLERAVGRNADVVRLLVRHLGQHGADLGEVQPRDLFVEVLRQRVNFFLVLGRIGLDLDLRQCLVGEGG